MAISDFVRGIFLRVLIITFGLLDSIIFGSQSRIIFRPEFVSISRFSSLMIDFQPMPYGRTINKVLSLFLVIFLLNWCKLVRNLIKMF